MAVSKVQSRVLCFGGMDGFRTINIKFLWMWPRLSRVVVIGNLGVFQVLYKIFSYSNARSMCIDGKLLRESTVTLDDICFGPICVLNRP